MNPAEDRRLLPHEIAMGAFLLFTEVRLLLAEGPLGAHTLLYAGLIAANLLAIRFASWRIRLLYYPIAMNILFWSMGSVVAVFHPGKEDGLLQQIDRAMLGASPCTRLHSLESPLLTELMSFCYLLFFPYLTLTLVSYYRGDLDRARRFYAGLFTIYGIGFFGYTLIPAVGPYATMAFQAPLTGGVLTDLNARVVAAGTTGVDVFPSLHCAVSLYLLVFDARHARRRFWILLVPVVGLCFSTIYLRYHYAIDVLVGFALAGLALSVAFAKGASRELSPRVS
jgi:membrane-associated phospholipid phosphatase